jgi:hypothetical protein
MELAIPVRRRLKPLHGRFVCGSGAALLLVAIIALGLEPANLRAQDCPELAGRWPYGQASSVAISADLGLVITGSVLQTVDLSDPASPELAGELDLPFVGGWVAVSGSFAYLVNGEVLVVDVSDPNSLSFVGKLRTDWNLLGARIVDQRLITRSGSDRVCIIDIQDPSSPIVELQLDHNEIIFDVSVSGDLLILAEFLGGFRVIDIQDPQAINEVGFKQLPDQLLGLAVIGGTAFVTCNRGLYSVDFDDPSNPTLVGFLSTGRSLLRPILLDELLLAIHDFNEFVVIDVGDPTNPTLVAELGGFRYIERLAASGEIALLVDDDVTLVDLSDSLNPTPIGVHRVAGSSAQSVVSGDHAVVASVTELRVFDVADPNTPIVVGELGLGGYGVGIAMAGETVFVAEMEAGLRVVDVSDPTLPTEIGFLEFSPGYLAKVAVSGGYAFVTDSWGIRMIDISDPTQPTTYAYGDCENPHDLVADDDFVYAACGADGLRVFEAWAGLGMQLLGSLVTGAPATGLDLRGDHVFLVDGDLHVIDIGDPMAPVEVGLVELEEDVGDVSVIGSRAYVFSANYHYAESVSVVSIGDPRNPEFLGNIATPGRPRDVDLVNGHLFVADSIGGATVIKGCQFFVDGFESGDVSAWSGTVGLSGATH